MVHLTLEYDADVFDTDTVAVFAAHLRTLVESIVVDPDTAVGDLQVLADTELERLGREWAAVTVAVPR